MILNLLNNSMRRVRTYDMLSKHDVLRYDVFDDMFILFRGIIFL